MDSKKVKLRGYGNSKLWQENDYNNKKKTIQISWVSTGELENVAISGKIQGQKSLGRQRAEPLEDFKDSHTTQEILVKSYARTFMAANVVWYGTRRRRMMS